MRVLPSNVNVPTMRISIPLRLAGIYIFLFQINTYNTCLLSLHVLKLCNRPTMHPTRAVFRTYKQRLRVDDVI